LAGAFWAPFQAAGEPVSYNRDIRPILSNTCFACHGQDANTRKAGLRLDVEEAAKAALRSGDFALVPGDRSQSTVYQRITATDTDDLMPPPESGHELDASERELIGRWIDEGAVYEPHWAFVPPALSPVPETANPDWPAGDLDRFILNRLEQGGISPSPAADPATLLRRVHLDLTGIPPTPEEQARFLEDDSPFAYEKVVDRLLASPRFGERWGRHWLDAARYADSNGYSIDSPRSIWPYRDYVINALNADLPFDQFVIEQMAGDLLPNATREQRVATGFHRNTMVNEEGGVDPEEFRTEAVLDRVNTIGTVFLGLTMACARCHDHKYDPVSQHEYFRLAAFMNNDDEQELSLPTPEQEEAIRKAEEEAAALRKELEAYLAGSEKQQELFEDRLPLRKFRELTELERRALLKPRAERDAEDAKVVLELFKKNDREVMRINGRLKELEAQRKQAPTTLVLAPLAGGRETRLLIQGSYGSFGEPVPPGYLDALHAPEQPGATRLDLAQWLVDRRNPLLARVTVNRFWQHLFGKGLVETENDFGLQGALPTHPELLDWLAVTFMDEGWRVKPLLRKMVLSSTYRQASRPRPDLRDVDPNNVLLARQNRLRLDAEIIRDAALTAAGVLDERIGGPSVFPPQPDGVTSLGQTSRPWNASEGADRYRRGMYTAFQRSTPYYALTVFDAPNAQEACTRRIRSNTPLQALTLLNDPSFVELAAAFAARLLESAQPTPQARIEEAFRLALGRTPNPEESTLLTGLYQRRLAEAPPEAAENAAWTMVARAILNLDEFVTRD
jgi:cytochrome c553